jgi:hypothetical protein
MLPILLICVICAQPSSHFPAPIPDTVNASNTIISTGNFSITNSSSEYISAGAAFLTHRLGAQYFGNYISYVSGFHYSSTNLTYLYYLYSIPFQNGTTTTAVINAQTAYKLGITLVLSSTYNATEYVGPSAPYTINISKGDAITTAGLYGVANGTASISAVENVAATGNTINGYSIAWAVTGGDQINSTNSSNIYTANRTYPGLYIDAASGNVIGEYIYSTSVKSLSKENYSIGISGNFDLFKLNSPAKSTIKPATPSTIANNSALQFTVVQATTTILISAALGLAAALAAVVIYYLIGRRNRR